MHGWRAQIGLLVPSKNTVNEPEWQATVPAGVSLHTARMMIGASGAKAHEQMLDTYERGGELLATADVDVAVFGCTTGSFVNGPGSDVEIENRLSDVAGCPGVATAAAVRRAFDALSLDSIVLATPYLPEINDREIEFFEAAGYDVVDADGLGIEDPVQMGKQRPEAVYRQVRELNTDEADGVFISCTNYRSFEIIDSLEADLDMPVVSSNSATLWDTLRTIGVDHSNVDLGALFET